MRIKVFQILINIGNFLVSYFYSGLESFFEDIPSFIQGSPKQKEKNVTNYQNDDNRDIIEDTINIPNKIECEPEASLSKEENTTVVIRPIYNSHPINFQEIQELVVSIREKLKTIEEISAENCFNFAETIKS